MRWSNLSSDMDAWYFPTEVELDLSKCILEPEFMYETTFRELCSKLNVEPVDYGFCRQDGVDGYSDFFIRFASTSDALLVKLNMPTPEKGKKI